MIKPIHFSIRLDKAEYEKIKRYAKQHALCMSQMLREIIKGNRCLCDDHKLQHLINNHQPTPESWEIFLNDCKEQIPFVLKLSFENLMLLRLLVQQQQLPDLIEQARQQRVKRFGLSEDTPKDS